MPNRPTLALLALSAILPATLSAQTIAAKTAGMKHLDGYLPLDWDAKTGKLYLEIPHLDATGHSPDLLYTHSLPYGTGSNDLGLDRGQISSGEILHFERTGPKVLLVERTERRQADEERGWGNTLYNPTPQEEALHQRGRNESKASTLRSEERRVGKECQ